LLHLEFGAQKQKRPFLKSKTVLFWPLFRPLFCEICRICSL
jgi:hypothetical protein